MSTTTPEQLHSHRSENNDALLIDVRTAAEFEEVHAADAINIPLQGFNAENVIARYRANSNESVFLICKMGGRSQKACDALAAAGFEQAVNVTGGTDAWMSAQLPVVRGTAQKFSIQRQVQILAGSIALVGGLLSFLNPLWAILPAFIGAGLVFSGLTNTCGMGSMLATMPWNQAPKPKSAKKPQTENATCDTGG